ncbi:MAG: ABC transporter permease [bacterium]
MSLIDTIETAITNLKINKFRSFLTILGVVIGISAIIIICALGEGNRINVLKEMEKIGADLLWINIDSLNTNSPSIVIGFEEEDLKAILQLCSKIRAVSFEESLHSVPFKYLNRKTYFTLKGINASYQKIHRLKLLKGRFISNIDEKIKARICILEDSRHTKEIFGMSNPVGKEVLINQQPFRIVGVVAYNLKSASS